jgi:hypothetical protein
LRLSRSAPAKPSVLEMEMEVQVVRVAEQAQEGAGSVEPAQVLPEPPLAVRWQRASREYRLREHHNRDRP